MIKSVTATNYLGESIKMELRFPEKSGFAVLDIAGLGPCKASINMTDSATSDGSVYNSARVTGRNIILSLKLLDNPNIETTRQLSYKYFPIKKEIVLLIETDNRICEAYGYVESNEPIIFSSQETAQISIICPDPYLYSAGSNKDTITVFSGIESMFSFPFGNESLSTKLIKLGEIILYHSRTVYYTGDSEIGIDVYIHALGHATNVTIYNVDTHESMKIDTNKLALLTGSGIIAGDDIIISTIKGKKSIYLLRNGEYINIINCIGKKSNWFQLRKGDNVFAFDAETGAQYLQFRIENRSVYEGV